MRIEKTVWTEVAVVELEGKVFFLKEGDVLATSDTCLSIVKHVGVGESQTCEARLLPQIF